MNRLFSLAAVTMRPSTHPYLFGPNMFVLMSALVLAGYWTSGEAGLMAVALGFPAALLVLARVLPKADPNVQIDDCPSRDRKNKLNGDLGVMLKRARRTSKQTACIMLSPDDFETIIDRYGVSVAQDLMNELCDRVDATVRQHDLVSKIGDHKLGIVLDPISHLGYDVVRQVVGRLREAVEKPIKLGESTIFLSSSIGFCMDSYFPNDRGGKMIQATEMALKVAQQHGPSSIRSFSPDMPKIKTGGHVVSTEIDAALDDGQIHAWFQPQISTDTGQITGFEALARWQHSERGIVSPAEFLPMVEEAGKMERLSAVILCNAMEALQKWDEMGLHVPQVGVNFAPEELGNPNLVKRIEWELDRFNLKPQRLAVEILETVVATSHDDVVARNISGLSELGCQIDLDDFGTGHASISSIRRFDIQRLKIDRSFVMKVDQDPEQQRMVSAILMMAERLELDTLAEGVEGAGEHAMLSQLGCGHVQGFGIGRPMPFDMTPDWISAHLAKLSDPPEIRFKKG